MYSVLFHLLAWSLTGPGIDRDAGYQGTEHQGTEHHSGRGTNINWQTYETGFLAQKQRGSSKPGISGPVAGCLGEN
jgi:hypothetical protein